MNYRLVILDSISPGDEVFQEAPRWLARMMGLPPYVIVGRLSEEPPWFAEAPTLMEASKLAEELSWRFGVELLAKPRPGPRVVSAVPLLEALIDERVRDEVDLTLMADRTPFPLHKK